MPGSYIRPACDIIAGPPFIHRNTTLHAFVVPGSQAKQQALLDTTINQIGPHFTAEADAVLFTALYVEDASSGQTGYSGRWASEIDVALWVLTKDANQTRRWFPVVMFVDRPAALLIGREVYGYPKQFATITRASQDYDNDFRVTVAADTFVPGNGNATFLPLIEVVAATSALVRADVQTVGRSEFEAELGKAFFPDAPGLVGGLATPYPGVPMLFMKQFRDIADPLGVCYQAVTEVSVVQNTVRDYGVAPSTFTLNIRDTAVHHIALVLGLAASNPIHCAFRIRQDFTVPTGKEIARASQVTPSALSDQCGVDGWR